MDKNALALQRLQLLTKRAQDDAVMLCDYLRGYQLGLKRAEATAKAAQFQQRKEAGIKAARLNKLNAIRKLAGFKPLATPKPPINLQHVKLAAFLFHKIKAAKKPV